MAGRFAPRQGPQQVLQIDASQAREFANDLATFAERTVPFAARNTLNRAAFEARGGWTDQMRRQLTLRNQYTERSPRVVKAEGTNLATMESRVGSPLAYLESQESGFTTHSKGKHGVPIPTAFSAGQGVTQRAKRTRRVSAKNLLHAITLAPEKIAHDKNDRRQRNAVAIKMAAKHGSKYVFLDMGKAKGIFKVTGTRNPMPRLVWNMSERTVHVNPHHMLMTASSDVRKTMPGIYGAEILAQMRRARILMYSRYAQFGL